MLNSLETKEVNWRKSNKTNQF